jgi:hypothetical protein
MPIEVLLGVGTTAPVAKLEVAGDTQVDGNLMLYGTIISPAAHS